MTSETYWKMLLEHLIQTFLDRKYQVVLARNLNLYKDNFRFQYNQHAEE